MSRDRACVMSENIIIHFIPKSYILLKITDEIRDDIPEKKCSNPNEVASLLIFAKPDLSMLSESPM